MAFRVPRLSARNVIDHLPDHMHAFVSKKMECAYKLRDFGAAKRSLSDLAKSLEAQHPGAAASLREGLEETLTVVRLGLSPSLQRTPRSTNTIESMISIGRTTMRNVKRWRDAKMIERWTAAGMLEAENASTAFRVTATSQRCRPHFVLVSRR